MTRRRGNREGTIYQRKDGRWCAELPQVGGKRKRLYARTREEVARKLVLALRDQEVGLPVPDDRLTVERYLTQWLETVRPRVRPWTYRGYEVVVRRHVVPIIGQVRLSRLTPQQVHALLVSLADHGLSSKSVRNVRVVLSSALSQAERWGMVTRNVARLVEPLRREHREMRPLTPGEIRRLLEVIRGHRLEALILVTLVLGLRQGEVLGLSWEDLDLDAGTLQVRRQLQRLNGRSELVELKTRRSRRTLVLPRTLVEVLCEHRRRQGEERMCLGASWKGWEHDLVFTTTLGTPLDGRWVTRTFQRLLAKAGIERRRFHDLRHSAATTMLVLGVPARVVMEILGHANVSTTLEVYAHVVPELQREAADRIDAFLRGVPW
ncbi:MAG TPA: site-specific integrase [Candidatus Dormibacteraeota bacterium]|nr:site-specific integrase [Candidatus Dormibacteraeota bacterium]